MPKPLSDAALLIAIFDLPDPQDAEAHDVAWEINRSADEGLNGPPPRCRRIDFAAYLDALGLHDEAAHVWSPP